MKKLSGLFLIVFLCAPLSLVMPYELEQEFLPIVWKSGGYEIIDCEGEEADHDWLIETFGDVTVQPGNGAKLTELSCDVSGISSLMVRVVDRDGESIEGAMVILNWLDAPELPLEFWGWYENGIIGLTNSEGRVNFAMGHSGYYFPPNGGPYSIWIHPNGDLLEGLGMIGGTNHTHLNSEWRVR